MGKTLMLYTVHALAASFEPAADCEIEWLSESEGTITEANGKRTHFYALKKGRETLIYWKGFWVNVAPKETHKKRAQEEFKPLLKAPMPGSILQILVSPDQHVSEGEALLVMESMKMELTLNAISSCHVSSILCQVGEMVAMNQTLMELTR
jgi:biotin carboxyl carrier protein